MRALPSLALAIALGCAADPEYVRCTRDDDCGGRGRCYAVDWRDGAGALCTEECPSASDCAGDARCLDVAFDGRFLCYPPCTADPDCRPGLICQPLSSGGSVCLPLDP